MEYIKFQNFINSVQYGYTADTTSMDGNKKYLRITDIVPYFVNKDKVPFVTIDEAKSEKYLVKKDDLLIARTGATTGYNLVVPDGFDNFIFASYLVRFFYDKNRLNPNYLKYVLKSQHWYGFINNYIGGSAQPGMNPKTFGKFELPYHHWPNQLKIANILSKYDKLIENNNNRIMILENMVETIFKEWFIRFRFPGYTNYVFDNGMPKGWKIMRIKELVKRLSFGRTYKESELSDDGTVIVIDQSSKEYLGFTTDKAEHEASFEEPLLLFGDHTCKYQLMCKNFSLGENIIPYQNNDSSIDRYFLFYATKDIIKTEEYKRHWNRFINLKIILPDIDVQIKFRKIALEISKEKEALWLENYNLCRQRDSLLPRLMSGKLSVEGKEVI